MSHTLSVLNSGCCSALSHTQIRPRTCRFLPGLVLLAFQALVPQISDAAIITTGDVTPDPTTTTSSDDLFVGDSADGTMTIDNGSDVLNRNATVGDDPNASGSVTVDGIGSTWTNNGNLKIGEPGYGTLNITGGGAVSNSQGHIGHGSISEPGSTGEVTVDGVGSTWTNTEELFIGFYGHGTLNITGGGNVVNNIGTGIGISTGSISVVSVDGIGSTWTNNGSLINGHRGNGTLSITGGGAVSNTDSKIGQLLGSTSEVTVDGVGSIWTNTGDLDVGSSGSGTLNISHSGTVNSPRAFIGREFDSTGVVTLHGGSIWTNTDSLYVGGDSTETGGNGTLNVQSDGLVDVTNTLKVWNSGTVTLNGGVIDAATIDHTDDGTFSFTDGTLIVDSFLGTLDQDGGTLAPGSSPGTTNINGNYVMNAGTLAIELGGLTAGTDFDQVVVAGNVALGGVLDVSLISLFTPNLGQAFKIVDVGGSLTGTFSGLSQAALVGNFGGTDLFIDYTGGDGNDISLVARLPGDFDFDNDVDGFDFLKWQRELGDASSLADWETYFGTVGDAAVAAVTSVPEPSSLVLCSVLVTGIFARRFHR